MSEHDWRPNTDSHAVYTCSNCGQVGFAPHPLPKDGCNLFPTQQEGELREKLAAIEHERWADWQKWCHKVLRENNPPPEQGDILERWDRQIETPYAELSEREKNSDREQVDRYWQLIEAHTQRAEFRGRLKELVFYRNQLENGNFSVGDCVSSMNIDIAELKSQLTSDKEKV